jgi:propionyl-CoA carboxylase alpha chain
LEIAYVFDRHGRLAELHVDGEPRAARLHSCMPSAVDLEVDGVRRTYLVDGDTVNTPDGQVTLEELPRFTDPTTEAVAGSLVSPMPGTVLRVAVEEGAEVQAGRPLLVLEAMKMEHEIVAPADGTVTELRVAAGAQVEAGAILAVVE